MEPILEVLVNGSPRVHGNVSTYLLPMVLQLDSSLIGHILEQSLAPLKGVLTSASDGHVRSAQVMLPTL